MRRVATIWALGLTVSSYVACAQEAQSEWVRTGPDGKLVYKTTPAGELTKEQAEAQMATLKKETARKDQDKDKVMAPPTKVKKDLRAAVEAGKTGKEDTPKKDIKKKPAARPDYDAIGRDLKAAVQAGKLTKEEAKAKWETLKKEAAGDKGEN